MILVTGSTGHLGANLVHQVLQTGDRVRVLLRPQTNSDCLDGWPIERVYGDLTQPATLAQAVAGCDRVYHCAAIVSTTAGNAEAIFATNVLGTRNLLEACHSVRVRRVVVSGSFSAVGQPPARPANEEDPFNPFARHLPYSYSKAAMEHECLKAAVNGLEVVIAVSCAIVGPHDFKPSRLGRTFVDFANGNLPFYIPGGFEYVAARDIVSGHLLAMEKGRTGQRYIFSTEFLSVDELINIWAEVSGQKERPLRLPPGLMAACAHVSSFVLTRWFPQVQQRFTPGAIRILRSYRRADIRKARTELGYRPTSIRQAVEESYQQFVERGFIKAV